MKRGAKGIAICRCGEEEVFFSKERGFRGCSVFFRGMAGIMMRYFILFRYFRVFLGWVFAFCLRGRKGNVSSGGCGAGRADIGGGAQAFKGCFHSFFGG